MTSGTETRIRSRHLTIRLSEDERAAIDAAADKAGLTAGSYAREKVIGGPVPRQVRRPPIERRELARLLGEVGKIGSNVNQLARAANSGTVIDGAEIVVALDRLREIRDAVLRALGRAA